MQEMSYVMCQDWMEKVMRVCVKNCEVVEWVECGGLREVCNVWMRKKKCFC